jgi:hypothetical protein
MSQLLDILLPLNALFVLYVLQELYVLSLLYSLPAMYMLYDVCAAFLACVLFVLDLPHKVPTYVEYRAVSGVFKNIDPPPLSTQRVCPPHAPKAGGTHSLGSDGVGGQYFGRRQTLDWPLTV